MEQGMAMLRNLFGHQKHHVQKVCVAHDGVQDFYNVKDVDKKNKNQPQSENDLLVSCGKKGKKAKKKSSKRKDKYQTNTITLHGNEDFRSPNVLLETGSVVEELDEVDGAICGVKYNEKVGRSSLKENIYGQRSSKQRQMVNGDMNNYLHQTDLLNTNSNANCRLVGTTHPSYLQTSIRSPKIRAACYCSNNVDGHFKPTPIHIFCADSDFGAGAGDSEDDDDNYDADSDFDDGSSKKGKKKTPAKGKSKSEKTTKTSKSKSKTNPTTSVTPASSRSSSKASGLKAAKSMPSIARTVSTPPSVAKSPSNVSGLSGAAGRRQSWVSPALASSNAKSPSLGGVSIKSPLGGGGLRLGLSKKMRVKPLHSSVKLQN